MIRGHNTDQNFQDGVVHIYTVRNIAKPGNRPVDGIKRKHTLRYEERTVGVTRYESAMQNNAQVVRLLRCPRLPDVSSKDIAVPIDGTQYHIRQVQYPMDAPMCMDLSLTKVVSVYEIADNP